MGGRMVLPEADDKMKKCIRVHMMKPKEVNKFWKLFKKLDKAKTGLVPYEDYLKTLEEDRNFFADSILECFEIDLDENGCLNFSDYLCLTMNYCAFEPPEIQKLCFYVFDEDKGGTVDADELKALMNSLYNVKEPNKVKGNPKASWKKLEFDEDLKVDYEEFARMNKSFPWLFLPAFRLQNNMMIRTFGELWWSNRKRRIQNFKDKIEEAYQKKQKKKEKKKKYAAQRHIRKRMGLIRFMLCPCLRYLYDTEKNELTAEERAARDAAIAAARRAADLAAKNPVTYAWKKFEAKVNAEVTAVPTLHNGSIDTKSLALLATTGSTTGGSAGGDTTGGSGASAGGNKNDSSPNKDGTSKSYLQTREEKIEKSREVRSDERNRRRYGRKHDSDLKYKQTSLFDA